MVRAHWVLFAITTVTATVSQAIGIPLALLTRRMVKLVAHEAKLDLSQAEIRHTLWILASMLVGLTILRGVCQWFRRVFGEMFAQRIIVGVRKQMLSHLHNLSLGYFDKRAAGKIVIRFVGDAQGLRGWLATKLVTIPADILTIAGVLVAIGMIHYKLLFAVIIPPLVLFPLLLVVNPRARLWTREARREQSRLTGDLTERFGKIGAIRAANAQHESIEPLNSKIDSIANAFVHRSYLDAWGQATALTVGSLSLCAIGILGSLLILDGQATSGDIVGAIWLCVLIRSPINRLTSTNIAYHRVRVAFDRIDALLDRNPEPGLDRNLEPYSGHEMRIRFKNIGFRDQSESWIVRSLNAKIQGPGLYLISGDRPATRTVQELILRLRRPHEGRIALDHRNARKLNVQDIRSRIGWVDRNRDMIGATLMAYAAVDLRPAWDSTHAIDPNADLDETIADWQHPAHTHRNIHRAATLRLALAAATIGDRPILLIDEPILGLGEPHVDAVVDWLTEYARHRLVIIFTDQSDLSRFPDPTETIVLQRPIESDCPEALPATT